MPGGPLTPSSASGARYPGVEALRAIAAFSVVAFHVGLNPAFAVAAPLRRFTDQANVGVSVFFLISGFLLYRPFAQAHLANRGRPNTWRYGARRLLRIVPAYWVALTALAFAGSAASRQDVLDHPLRFYLFGQVYWSDTITSGIGQAWTLCVELSFYALLPAYALLIRALARTGALTRLRVELAGLAMLIVLSALFRAIFVTPNAVPDAHSTFFVLPAVLDEFALGMLLAVVSASDLRRARYADSSRFALASWATAGVGFAALALTDPTTEVTHWFQAGIGVSLLAPAVLAMSARGPVQRVLSNRGLASLGMISYGVYLWHYALITRLGKLPVSAYPGIARFVGLTGTLVVAVVVVAALSFYLVERPALRLKPRSKESPRSAGPAAGQT